MTLILASGSPRRRELLARLHVPFEVRVSQVDERLPLRGETPAGYAFSLALDKGRAVASLHPDATVLAADTVVALDDTFLAKPEDDEDALRMLRILAGRTHQVVTGVAVLSNGRVLTGAESTDVVMRPLGDEALRAYIATGEPSDKAGAYAIQGYGRALVAGIDGCYENVVGLPVGLAVRLLEASGLDIGACAPLCTHLRLHDPLPEPALHGS